MKNTFLILGLMATTILSTNAWADVNCYDYCQTHACSESTTCKAKSNQFGEKTYYSINGTEMTVYGPSTGDGILIPGGAFYDSANGVSTMPPSVVTVNFSGNISTLGGTFFKKATNLTNVILPDTLTSLGGETFRNTNLHTITIPDSVTGISNSAFQNCVNLTSVILGDRVGSIGRDVINGIAANGKIYCQENVNRKDGNGVAVSCAEVLTKWNSEDILNKLQLFIRDDDGEMILYDQNSDGTIISNGKVYANLEALRGNEPISANNTQGSSEQVAPKRIYTVEEARQAVEAAGTETVNVRIRYK